jgi:hypothetical protein
MSLFQALSLFAASRSVGGADLIQRLHRVEDASLAALVYWVDRPTPMFDKVLAQIDLLQDISAQSNANFRGRNN